MEFVKSQFDKLLMLAVFAALLAVFYHAMHHPVDAGALAWLQQKTGEALASILTLTAARAIAGKNGNPPAGDAGAK